jgi:hypothetical protein
LFAFVKRTLKLERIPPIIVPFIIPFLIVYFVFKVVTFLLMWIFGFWKCYKCKRIYWAKEEKTYHLYNEYGPDHYTCGNCKVLETLSKN